MALRINPFCTSSADILQDASLPQEPTTAEVLDMRKMYENERMSNKIVQPLPEDFECWQTISNKMLPNARELCEQLRLILEPTKCTRLRGDYRTGRRINMKKVNWSSFSHFEDRFHSYFLPDHSIHCIAIPQGQNLAASNEASSA